MQSLFPQRNMGESSGLRTEGSSSAVSLNPLQTSRLMDNGVAWSNRRADVIAAWWLRNSAQIEHHTPDHDGNMYCS